MAARTQRTLLEKKNILKAYENLSTDLTKSEKAKKLKIPLSTLHGILKDKDILQDKKQIKRVGKRIRWNRDGIYNTIDSAVCKWVEKARGKGYAINANIVFFKLLSKMP